MSANQCLKYLKECQASCCHGPPLPKWKIVKFKDKITRAILKTVKLERGQVRCITNPNLNPSPCPFLRNSLRCNIYPDRPHTCKIFGSGKDDHPHNHCDWLNGKIERRTKGIFGNIK